MSAIAPRIQSAILKWLLQESTRDVATAHSFRLATMAEDVDVVSVGQRATIQTNRFTLNFYAGFGNDQIAMPAVVISCNSATSQPDLPCIWESDVTIALEYQCDESVEIEYPQESSEGAANWINDMLCDGEYSAVRIMEADPDLIVMGVYGVSTRVSIDGDKRVTSIQTDFKITASI